MVKIMGREKVIGTKGITTDRIDGKIWMMKRVCPNCNKPIKDSNLYFCLSCGQKLDEDLIKHEHPFKPKIEKFSPSKENQGIKLKELPAFQFKKKFLIGLFFVIMAGAVSTAAIMFTVSKADRTEQPSVATPQEQPVAEISVPNAQDLGLPQENIDLANQDYTKYIPYGNHFYILGADVLDFYSRFFGSISEDSLLYGLDEYIEGKFIVIGGKEEDRWQMTAVLYLKDDESEGETFEDISKDGWYVRKVGDVLVLSESEDMLDAVEESSQGVSRNISHHPKFRTSGEETPEEGQLLFVNLLSDENIIQEMVNIYSPGQPVIESIKDIYAQNPEKFVVRSTSE